MTPCSRYNSLFKQSILLIFCLFSLSISAQLSYGGQPLPLQAHSMARTVEPARDFFVEMPSFNQQEAITRSQSNQARFKSLDFAHKFYVHLRPDNSGVTFNSIDQTTVWRVGIRSRQAKSINILFTKFRLPKGAKVFVYNADQSEILGSYTHQNNSELNLLPIQPIAGEEVIVEYQEPANAAFKGEIEIGEINHDYLGILRATEPRDPQQDCHPNLVCYPQDIETGQGVLALIINGTTYCTGSLVNNTSEDGTPYLLTATHCLNKDYDPQFIANRQYDIMAGSIVAFFNYKSPSCTTNIRGPLQMSLTSATPVLISENHDISLLKLNNTPPKEYQPIYLGWNVSTSPSAPFHGIHTPNGGVLKVAVNEGSLTVGSFSGIKYNMTPNSHWIVKAWSVGNTEGGSSGSPLLDKDKRIVGTLTGGESMCSAPRGPDLYASLTKCWNVENDNVLLGEKKAIKNYLDPLNVGILQMNAFNPFANNPIKRSQNFDVNETATQTYHNSVAQFSTNNTYGYTEFAEEFNTRGTAQLEGVFISSPQISNILNLNVRIRVYQGGDNGPEALVYETPFNFSYSYYDNGNFGTAPRDMKRNVENYIKFDKPISVSGKFHISYSDGNNTPTGFSAMNVEPRKAGSGIASTTWMKNATEWIKSSENIENPINTSLLIAPYVLNSTLTPPTDPSLSETEIKAYYHKEADRIFIESNKDLISWEIFYVSGQKIFQGKTDSSINRTSFPIGHFAKGVYIVTVKVDGLTKSMKVLVN